MSKPIEVHNIEDNQRITVDSGMFFMLSPNTAKIRDMEGKFGLCPVTVILFKNGSKLTVREDYEALATRWEEASYEAVRGPAAEEVPGRRDQGKVGDGGGEAV